jgi:hypothetical protein
MIRCRLVFENTNSTFVNTKLTSTRKRVPPTLDGVSLVESKMTAWLKAKRQLGNIFEGNYVASALKKWALLSQSVVLPKLSVYYFNVKLISICFCRTRYVLIVFFNLTALCSFER